MSHLIPSSKKTVAFPGIVSKNTCHVFLPGFGKFFTTKKPRWNIRRTLVFLPAYRAHRTRKLERRTIVRKSCDWKWFRKKLFLEQRRDRAASARWFLFVLFSSFLFSLSLARFCCLCRWAAFVNFDPLLYFPRLCHEWCLAQCSELWLIFCQFHRRNI